MTDLCARWHVRPPARGREREGDVVGSGEDARRTAVARRRRDVRRPTSAAPRTDERRTRGAKFMRNTAGSGIAISMTLTDD